MGGVDLKGNTKGKKPTHVAGGIVKISKKLVNIIKEVFITEDISFVNGKAFLFHWVAILPPLR